MPQHDYIIDNQTFPAFRSDLNNALAATATSNSGASEPIVTYPNQEWADTTNLLLKRRNTGNTAWLTVGKLNQTDYGFLNDSVLTGNPTAATQAVDNNSTRVATTAFVKNSIFYNNVDIADGVTANDAIRKIYGTNSSSLGSNIYRVVLITANLNLNTAVNAGLLTLWIKENNTATDIQVKLQGVPAVAFADNSTITFSILRLGTFTGTWAFSFEGQLNGPGSYVASLGARKITCLYFA
jgi:hypothetical protein